MIKWTKIFIGFFVFLLILILSVKIFDLNKNKDVLNFFAKYYFDTEYYLETYPEVKEASLDPFNHYTNQGWKENKNPNKNFDTHFYKNVNYRFNKYDLNPLQHFIKSKFFSEAVYTNLNQLKKVELLDNPKYDIALVAIFQNEARFLKEWIEFYKLMGVEHFYLYDHLSKDEYKKILQPYIDEGIVDLYHITIVPKTLKEWNVIQTQAYLKTIKSVKNEVEWLVIVDTDEFLFPLEEQNLSSVLKRYNEYATLSVNWKMFGSGDVEKVSDQELSIENLLMSEESENHHVKSIVKPRYVRDVTNPHFPLLKPGYFQTTEDYTLFKGPFSPEAGKNILRINHYWARDWDFFRSIKLSRVHIANPNLSEDEKQKIIDAQINMNHQISIAYDGSILKYVPELKAAMKFDKSSP